MFNAIQLFHTLIFFYLSMNNFSKYGTSFFYIQYIILLYTVHHSSICSTSFSRSLIQNPLLHSLTIGRTVPKESDGLDILGVTFDSKITFEKLLTQFPEQLHCSILRNWRIRLSILKKSWLVFTDRLLHQRYFWGFVLQVFRVLFFSVVLGCRYKP